ncbi:MAG: adenylosuccinate lyase [Anaerolineales bacterium]|nr:adenylosuccinate lyase [Anaerolineales bacterium]
MSTYRNYLSPFSWRYATPAMRAIWSEHHRRLLWRQIWVALAEVQSEYGLVSAEQVANLRQHMQAIDIPRALAIESEIQHDLMAEVRTFAEQAPVGAGILHLGATSMDVEDNTDVLRLRQALDLILARLADLLRIVSRLIAQWAETPVMAFTHIQPAEPSTLGYRLALYGQDLLEDYRAIGQQRTGLRGKGFKGAVGTGAAYAELIGAGELPAFEAALAARLDLPFFPVTSQTYPRRQDYTVLSALAGLGGSLYKFAFDLRLLQSPPFGELGEPFGEKQVGSSAMPFKRNPVQAEKINSLARYLAGLPRLAWDNAAHSLLERTLDDSANRRILLPEACLAVDELLHTATGILSQLRVDEAAIQRNFAVYGPFAATERVLMALVKAGADRQAMHESIRAHAMQAWEILKTGGENPLIETLCADAGLLAHLTATEIRDLMNARDHVGDAPVRAHRLARTILEEVG